MSRAIVVVPCYNEARRLNLRALQEYGRRADSAELLFVNDGSRDETPQLIEQLHRGQSARFHYLHLAQNSGKAEAVRQGLLRALALGAELVGFWDADLATPLSSIEPFRRVLDAKPQIDLVIGTRMLLLGHAIERRPLRYYLGRLFARTASLALGMRIFDTQCGAKLFRVTPQLAQTCARPFSARWIFDVEMFARLERARRDANLPSLDQAIYEFPLDDWRDVAGSTLTSGDFVKAIGELARIYWTYLRPGASGVPSIAGPDAAVSPALMSEPRRNEQQAA